MSTSSLPKIPAFRKQQLYLEFARLKSQCPEGIYLSLTPGEPALWSGVLFVCAGPYAPAILRLQITFPAMYPDVPPIFTFSTDIFHPLVVPLTTHTFSTGSVDPNQTVSSASDAGRLPPGAFSLRDGFPHWFGGPSLKNAESCQKKDSGRISGVLGTDGGPKQTSISPQSAQSPARPEETTPHRNAQSHAGSEKPNLASQVSASNFSIVTVLEYVKSAFENMAMLDNLPLEAAGNPSAWHAWRSYRGLPKVASRVATPEPGSANPNLQKQPGEWNWDGVWEKRVRKGVDVSLSEQVLFGGAGRSGIGTTTGDMVRFLKMDEAELKAIRNEMIGTGSSKATPSS